MKILAFTDIHGSYKKVEEIIKLEHAQVVLIGGDLTNVGTIKEAEIAISQFQSVSKNLLAVTGNMDLPRHDDLFSQMGISLNGNGVIINGVGFFGASASPFSPLHTPNEISEETILKMLKQGYQYIKGAKIKIMVSHAPPYGSKVDITHSGIHVGSTAVREFIEDEQPDVVICGHIHEARGQDVLGKTKIVNCGQAGKGYYASIEMGNGIRIFNKEFR
jgi:Icc-related predicted phosphoesterase